MIAHRFISLLAMLTLVTAQLSYAWTSPDMGAMKSGNMAWQTTWTENASTDSATKMLPMAMMDAAMSAEDCATSCQQNDLSCDSEHCTASHSCSVSATVALPTTTLFASATQTLIEQNPTPNYRYRSSYEIEHPPR